MEDKSNSKVVVTYLVEAEDLEKAANAIAHESSTGTWVELPHLADTIAERYSAEIVSMEKRGEKIAIVVISYPLEMFETDNLSQLLSIIAGNLLQIRAIKSIKLIDFDLPDKFVNANRGPNFGIVGVRDKLRIYNRPLIAAVVKPKIGVSLQNYAKYAYEAWAGGADIVRDDENLTDQDISPFYERVNVVMEALRKAESVTGEKKMYIPNVSARLSEMYARAKFVQEVGGTAVMVDAFSVGLSGLQFMRDQNLDLVVHGHRLGGLLSMELSMLAVARLVRLAGVDFVQVPTHFGSAKKTGEDLTEINKFLVGPYHKLNTVMPVSAGGLHPGHIEKVIELVGKDQVISIGGGIMAHPMGIESGARAVRKAVEGVAEGKRIREIAETSVELKAAIDKWGIYGEEGFRDHTQHTNLFPLVKADPLELTKQEDNNFTIKTVESRDEL